MKQLPCSRCSSPVAVAEPTAKATCWRCIARMHTAPRQGTVKKHKLTRNLRAAVRSCCNFGNVCLPTTKPCAVLDQRFCEWFQNAVIPSSDPQTQLDYREQFLAEQFIESRRCTCGTALRPRERLCEKCRSLARRKSWRLSQQERRTNSNGGHVNS